MAQPTPPEITARILEACQTDEPHSSIAARFGLTPAGVSTIARRHFGPISRDEFRRRLRARSERRGAELQAAKIANGETTIEHRDGLLFVTVSGREFTFDPDAETLIRSYCWRVGGPDKNRLSRAVRHGDKWGRISVHHDIMGVESSTWIDHINRDPSDNRRCNLRVCNPMQNQWNRAPMLGARVPYKGVSVQGRRFVAQINVDGRTRYLGSFPTASEAASAYDAAARENFGEFAWLNCEHFPDPKDDAGRDGSHSLAPARSPDVRPFHAPTDTPGGLHDHA